MPDEVIRLTWDIPATYDDPSIGAHLEQNARRQFADALFNWVSTHAGGIVGPIHFREETQRDFFVDVDFRRTTMYCHVTELPAPPQFTLLGGPAHNRIIRTNGEEYWRVPMAPPMPSAANIADEREMPRPRHAEYRRVHGTQAYQFTGIREG
jgi:hypothetical protein